MKKALLFFCVCFCFTAAFAQQQPAGDEQPVLMPGQTAESTREKTELPLQYAEPIQTDDELYMLIGILLKQTTSVNLLQTQPASKAEVAVYLQSIDTGALDAAGMHYYEAAYNYLYKQNYIVSDGIFTFDTNGIFALQGQYSDSKKLLPADNVTHYNNTPALITVPISINFSRYVNFGTTMELKKGFWATQLSMPFTNMILKSDALDVQFPHQVNATVANPFFSFTAGRGRHSIGDTLTGSFLVANANYDLDFFSLRFFLKDINTSMNVYIMERNRLWFNHSFAFRITKYVGVRIFEGALEYGGFDARYLLPTMMFHNLYGWDEPKIDGLNTIGSQFGFAIDIVPYHGLRLYGQFAMLQFQTGYERKNFPEESAKTPNGLGGIAGLEYSYIFKPGILTFATEFTISDPFMNILEHKKISFIDYHMEHIAPDGFLGKDFALWLINPLGPDTIAVATKISFNNFFNYGAALQYRFVAKGQNEDAFFADPKSKVYYPSSKHPELATLKTPSGNPLYVHTLSISGYDEVYKNLKLKAQFDINFFSGRKKYTALYASASIEYAIK